MKILGNILWFCFAGAELAFSWFLAGLFWCITIVGIPIGIQCFKFARLSLFPFGKDIIYSANPVSLLLNIIWLIFSGIPLAIASFSMGILLCVTIIGIPFGIQCFKIAGLALMPFGAKIKN